MKGFNWGKRQKMLPNPGIFHHNLFISWIQEHELAFSAAKAFRDAATQIYPAFLLDTCVISRVIPRHMFIIENVILVCVLRHFLIQAFELFILHNRIFLLRWCWENILLLASGIAAWKTSSLKQNKTRKRNKKPAKFQHQMYWNYQRIIEWVRGK